MPVFAESGKLGVGDPGWSAPAGRQRLWRQRRQRRQPRILQKAPAGRVLFTQRKGPTGARLQGDATRGSLKRLCCPHRDRAGACRFARGRRPRLLVAETRTGPRGGRRRPSARVWRPRTAGGRPGVDEGGKKTKEVGERHFFKEINRWEPGRDAHLRGGDGSPARRALRALRAPPWGGGWNGDFGEGRPPGVVGGVR